MIKIDKTFIKIDGQSQSFYAVYIDTGNKADFRNGTFNFKELEKALAYAAKYFLGIWPEPVQDPDPKGGWLPWRVDDAIVTIEKTSRLATPKEIEKLKE